MDSLASPDAESRGESQLIQRFARNTYLFGATRSAADLYSNPEAWFTMLTVEYL